MARLRGRHWLIIITFVLFVIMPAALWGWYLWTRAVDQYTSTTSFSVRKEEGQSSIDLLGGLSALGVSTGTAADTDVLFEVIRSPNMVHRLNQQMNLVGAFTHAWPHDFLFAYNPSGTQEDLTEYWNRQIKVLLDNNAGIITVRANAFTPAEALQIADLILSESEQIVNALSDKALSDATRLAESQMIRARDELIGARQNMTAFRVRTQIVDPTADLSEQMEVLGSLRALLAEEQVTLDQLRQNARPSDHRIVQAEQRLSALQRQIEQERTKFSGTTDEGENYALTMHEYERLAVDLEFAEGAHTAARLGYEAAFQNAQRQSRYLAAHIQPALAESSLVPNRPWLLALGIGLMFILWSAGVLIFYSIRDRA